MTKAKTTEYTTEGNQRSPRKFTCVWYQIRTFCNFHPS